MKFLKFLTDCVAFGRQYSKGDLVQLSDDMQKYDLSILLGNGLAEITVRYPVETKNETKKGKK